MMRLVVRSIALAASVAALGPSALAAERKLTGPEIESILGEVTVSGKNDRGVWKQYFSAQGQTAYVGPGEPPSSGNWHVKADQYCSVWPPSGSWVCYDVEGEPEATPPTVTWIGESGTRYPGTVEKGNKL